MKRNYFLSVILLFYIITFLSPIKLIYFSTYFISTFFFYLYTKNIRISLLYSLLLSLFSDVSLAGSLFLMEPQVLNIGSGWSLAPMSLLILCLIPLSLRDKFKNIQLADIILFLFFLWGTVSIFFFPNVNVLYGIISLAEIITTYVLLRLYLSRSNSQYIQLILVSILLFESLVGLIQLFLQRPLGILAEATLFADPFGLVTPEETSFFRVSGTFVHPNNFAAVLLAILPFLFFTKFKNKNLGYLFILPSIVLFFTYSRAAWVIFAVIAILMFRSNHFFKSLREKLISYKSLFIMLVLVTGAVIIFQPYISKRMQSVSLALTEFGSWGVRMKLTQEALGLISQYPLTGVGLNRSVEVYVSSPVTNLLEILGSNKYYRIHNIFLGIATETGIPGLILFSLFLILVIKHYFELKTRSIFQKAAFYGLIGLIGMSMFNPYLHSSQFRLFFLLSAIILTNEIKEE